MQRWSEPACRNAEFPGRDYLDEPRFSGGRERTRNMEEEKHEPKSHLR